MKKPTHKSAAIVTIKRASNMTPSGRKAIAAWLRMQASLLLKHGPDYSDRFTGRYLYNAR